MNGVRAIVKKDFDSIMTSLNTDVLGLQETKAQDNQVSEVLKEIKGYWIYSNSAIKKGYSGTAIISKTEPIKVTKGIGIEEFDNEGRTLTVEFKRFILVTVYTPNSQNGLKRIEYRKSWDKAFQDYIIKLNKIKPVIVCGDLNVAHQAIDIKNDKSNYYSCQ